MEICVPHPTLDAPRAAIFVFLQSSNGRMWFSLASVADLRTLFLLNEQDGAAISDALAKATSIAQGYQVAKVELDSVLHGIAGLT